MRNIKQIPTEGHSAEYLPGRSRNCQGHQKQGKSEKLSQPRGAQRDMMTECHGGSWVGLRKGKKDSGKTGDLNEVWTLVNENKSILRC